MGFKEIITVTKERRHASYKEWILCLDEVENLGSFLEIEYIGTKNVEIVQKEEKDFLKTLLISEEDIVLSGYHAMLCQKLFSKDSENKGKKWSTSVFFMV